MSRFKLLLISTLITSSAFASDTDPFSGAAYVKGGAVAHLFDDDRGVDNSATLYFGGGYYFNRHWAIDVEYLSGNVDFDNSNADVDYSMFSVMGQYRYNPLFKDSWFARTGFGNYEFGSSEVALRAGAGYEKFIQSNLSYTITADLIKTFDDSDTDLTAGIGLVYYFETSSKPQKSFPKPEPRLPADADGDGVIDASDNCPNSFKGAQVDASGCELDSDNDGVINRLDQCPRTPSGYKVDKQGCSIDNDQDGVLNAADQCPRTPLGAKVDAKGCEEKLAKEVTFDLNVQFANNSMEIQSAYVDKIQALAEFMKQYPSAKVVIEGHTDSRGSASYNQRLSQQRAEAVQKYLEAEFNIDGARLSALGRGEEAPIADNATAEGRQLNRRVVAVVKATTYQ